MITTTNGIAASTASTTAPLANFGEKFGGVKPANFLDIGGGASAQVMAEREEFGI